MADHHTDADHHAHSHGADGGGEDYTHLLDLEAEVLADYWRQCLDLVRGSGGDDVRRALDCGAGTGIATVGLAQRFPTAGVLAVDMSAESLQRVQHRAAAAGVDDRVRTICADLDAGWPDLGELDLTWASMSLHHLADPPSALRELHAMTRPGGALALAELGEPMRVLPADCAAVPSGLEERLVAISSAAHQAVMPTLGSPWRDRVEAAGWQVTDEHTLTIDVTDDNPAAYEYAYGWLSRMSRHLDDLTDPDRSAWSALLEGGPDGLRRRTALHLRGSRTITLARRDR